MKQSIEQEKEREPPSPCPRSSHEPTPRPLHLGPVLQGQVHLLQLRLGRLRPRAHVALHRPPLPRDRRRTRSTLPPRISHLPEHIDTLYFGGGTPSLLDPAHIRQLFAPSPCTSPSAPTAEFTLECAPGQLTPATLEAFQRQGLNRVSPRRPVLHRPRVRRHRPPPHRTTLPRRDRPPPRRRHRQHQPRPDLRPPPPDRRSWLHSLDTATRDRRPPHQRLHARGRRRLAPGQRNPQARPTLQRLRRPHRRRIRRLVRRRPATSSTPTASTSTRSPTSPAQAINPATTSSTGAATPTSASASTPTPCCSPPARLSGSPTLTTLTFTRQTPLSTRPPLPKAPPPPKIIHIASAEAFEESLFLGLRLNEGVSLSTLRTQFGDSTIQQILLTIEELCEARLLQHTADRIALTDRGRAISNEVFSRLLLSEPALA